MKKYRYLIILFLFNLIAVPASADEAANSPVTNEIIELGTATTQSKQQNQPDTTNNKTAQSIQDEQSGYSQGSVTRSIFTTQIAEHEPVDKIEKLQSSSRSVYYFTELRDMSGQTAIHRWEFNGNVMAETKFDIAGPRWRVWSSKNLMPGWTGEWKVSVLNGVGDVISEDIFNYIDEINQTAVQQQNSPEIQGENSSTENNYTNNQVDP